MRLAMPAGYPLFLALFVAAGAAQADPARDALTQVAKCADIADASARLTCFDAAAALARSALAAPPPPAAAAPVPEKRSLLEWFGFSSPADPVRKPEDFGKAPAAPPDEITEITSTVVEFAKNPRGKAIFILDNGQVWRQADGDSTVVRDPSPGETPQVTIAKGAFTSYNLTIQGRNGLIKVVRVK
jgi:hypothetical protein